MGESDPKARLDKHVYYHPEVAVDEKGKSVVASFTVKIGDVYIRETRQPDGSVLTEKNKGNGYQNTQGRIGLSEEEKKALIAADNDFHNVHHGAATRVNEQFPTTASVPPPAAPAQQPQPAVAAPAPVPAAATPPQPADAPAPAAATPQPQSAAPENSVTNFKVDGFGTGKSDLDGHRKEELSDSIKTIKAALHDGRRVDLKLIGVTDQSGTVDANNRVAGNREDAVETALKQELGDKDFAKIHVTKTHKLGQQERAALGTISISSPS